MFLKNFEKTTDMYKINFPAERFLRTPTYGLSPQFAAEINTRERCVYKLQLKRWVLRLGNSPVERSQLNAGLNQWNGKITNLQGLYE